MNSTAKYRLPFIELNTSFNFKFKIQFIASILWKLCQLVTIDPTCLKFSIICCNSLYYVWLLYVFIMLLLDVCLSVLPFVSFMSCFTSPTFILIPLRIGYTWVLKCILFCLTNLFYLKYFQFFFYILKTNENNIIQHNMPPHTEFFFS